MVSRYMAWTDQKCRSGPMSVTAICNGWSWENSLKTFLDPVFNVGRARAVAASRARPRGPAVRMLLASSIACICAFRARGWEVLTVNGFFICLFYVFCKNMSRPKLWQIQQISKFGPVRTFKSLLLCLVHSFFLSEQHMFMFRSTNFYIEWICIIQWTNVVIIRSCMLFVCCVFVFLWSNKFMVIGCFFV